MACRGSKLLCPIHGIRVGPVVARFEEGRTFVGCLSRAQVGAESSVWKSDWSRTDFYRIGDLLTGRVNDRRWPASRPTRSVVGNLPTNPVARMKWRMSNLPRRRACAASLSAAVQYRANRRGVDGGPVTSACEAPRSSTNPGLRPVLGHRARSMPRAVRETFRGTWRTGQSSPANRRADCTARTR